MNGEKNARAKTGRPETRKADKVIRRLRAKIVLVVMGMVTLVLLAVCLAVVLFTNGTAPQTEIEGMRERAFRPGEKTSPGMPREERLRASFRVVVYPDGHISAEGNDLFDLSDEDYLKELVDLARRSGDNAGEIAGRALRFFRETRGEEEVFAFIDVSAEKEMASRTVRLAVLIACGCWGLFFILALLFSKSATRPVEEAWEKQKQFVADASHELKTPLTVIMTNAELLASGEAGPGESAKFADNILTMSRQMRGLTEGLLELARIDATGGETAFGEVSFSKIAEEAALPFEPLYFENGLTLDSRIEPGLSLPGSERHLRQLCDILLDNALKYAEKGTTVFFSAKRSGRNVLLMTRNRADDIPEEDLKRLFERFYRVSKAREMNRSYGLGLAIAKEIAVMHRGRIRAESADGTVTFTVTLPA